VNPSEGSQAGNIDQRWYRRFDKILADPVLKGKIIDVGSKHGTLAFRLAKHYDVTAIDIDAQNVEIMRMLAARNGLDLPIHQASIHSLPFGDDSVDTVILSQVLEHVRNPDDLGELMRVLKPSGVIVVTTNLGFAHWAPDHCWFFLPRDIYVMLHHGWFFMKDQRQRYAFLRYQTVVPFEDFCLKYLSPWFEYQLYDHRESRFDSLEIYARIYKRKQTNRFPTLDGEILWREIKSDTLAKPELSYGSIVHRR